uniref:Transmembrane protein n=1 Tax=Oryza glumipatula TaxID=40148 RepID=A0A0D9ZBC8_9ORYZ
MEGGISKGTFRSVVLSFFSFFFFAISLVVVCGRPERLFPPSTLRPTARRGRQIPNSNPKSTQSPAPRSPGDPGKHPEQPELPPAQRGGGGGGVGGRGEVVGVGGGRGGWGICDDNPVEAG